MPDSKTAYLRAQALSDIVGNRHLIDLLVRSRLPQSALFAGPEGIGKRTIATLLAARENCRNPSSDDLCGSCPSCTKTLSGFHPDIRFYPAEEPANTIGIDEIRGINQEAQYLPFEGNQRAFIIDRAERMTPEAQNALLKTLEEPPSTSHLFLVTSYPQRLLTTIRSRCQMLNFRPLHRQEIEAFLKGHTQLDEPELRASFAGGSLGEALILDLKALLGRRDRVLGLLEAWFADESFEAVFSHTEGREWSGLVKKRDSVAQLLDLVQSLCYDIHFQLVGTPERIVNRDCTGAIEGLARQTSDPLQLHHLLEAVVEARRDIERYVNPQMCFETLWLSALRKGRKA